MIEIVDPDRCTECNICVHACPTNVFDAVPNKPPVIARQDDCQTCFMCELYCPDDALYVAPDVDPLDRVHFAALTSDVAFGSYRRAIGWSKDESGRRSIDNSFKLLGR